VLWIGGTVTGLTAIVVGRSRRNTGSAMTTSNPDPGTTVKTAHIAG
jgi:hypothetical protein